MPKISLAGFKDPIRRPRYIIWIGVIVMFIAAAAVVVLGLVSSRWFCAAACHKVQDDAVLAYQHSSHNKVSCLSCHLPVNANPISFILHKITALGELYLTVTNKYEFPMNPESELALTTNEDKMSSERCTQCHSSTRVITPSKGIIIDHKVHEEKKVGCTYCHNRAGHKEDFTLTLAGNKKHPDFMKMTACFRCHSLEKDAKAPGKCAACHPKDFKLKPENHLVPGFYPKGHAEMAKTDGETVAEAKKEEAALKAAAGEKKEGEAPPWELEIVGAISYCGTCHQKAFCGNCHGMEMPHPAAFKEPKAATDAAGHPAMSKTKADKCEFCHKQSKTAFCSKCHHGTYVKWTFDVKIPWDTQHAATVQKNGVQGCLTKCHKAPFCNDCHTARKPFPSSHKDGQWLHGPQQPVSDGTLESAKTTAKHAINAKSQPVACEICHGAGGTKAQFCMNCHKSEMPHPKEFTKFHSKTGRDNPAVCANCHNWPELCGNCHHKGAVNTTPWAQQHPKTVFKDGTAGCFEKCHKKDFCVTCHTTRKVVPASHNVGNWTRRQDAKVKAEHTTLFTKSPDSCTYCHGDGGTKAAFCSGCHKLEMPHPAGFGPPAGAIPDANNGGTHAADFQKNKLSRDTCVNCHTSDFCNSCHHKPGFKGGSPWLKQHPEAVKTKGAEPCFKCHKETFCSYCHVRIGSTK
jgi:nitrate/TMAO reductase-like tetraheme cytochrome c subunit